MAWRDTLQSGSFRGAGFKIKSHTLNSGRRGQLHEYPLRDTPYFEDLGRKTREFSVECFIIGENYNSARDALIAACEASGVGTLIHPYLGTKQVVCTTFSMSEMIDDGRMCSFNINFTEAGANLFPTGTTDVQFQVATMSAAADLASLSDFVASYQADGMPSFVFDGVASITAGFINTVTGISTDVDLIDSAVRLQRNLSGLMRTPSDFGSSIIDLIKGLRTSIHPRPRNSTTARAAVDAMRSLSVISSSAEVARISQITPSRVAEAGNMDAVTALIRRVALSNESVAVPALVLESYQDAITAAQDYVARIDAELMNSDARSEAYLPLTNLAAVVSSALTKQAGALPTLTTTTVGEPMPSLALSYELYADPTKAADIAKRNRVRHPSFVPANTPLEVLAR